MWRPWIKTLVLAGLCAGSILAFDLQISPYIKKLAYWIRQQDETRAVAQAAPVTLPTKTILPTPILPVATVVEPAPSPEPAVAAEPALAEVELDSEPLGATVLIDDKNMGVTPLRLKLPLDKLHTVLMEMNGMTSVRRELKLEEGKLNHLLAALQPVPVPAAPPVAKFDAGVYQKSVSTADLPALEVEKKRIKKSKELAMKETPKGTPDEKTASGDKFFTVQVVSTLDAKEAAYHAALYEVMGYQAFVCSAEGGVQKRYRVRLGQFRKRQEAEKAATKIRAQGLEHSPWVVFEDGLCPQLISATPWQSPI